MRIGRLRLWAAWGLAAFVAVAAARPAHAVPSYAAQTGQPCTACHVGAYGPQLTPFGRAFKISGYTLTGGDGLASHIPLSAMVLSSFTNTAQSQPGPAATHFSPNNNFALDQVSLFLAGRLNDYAGAFVQGTYSGVSGTTHWDNTDIRVTSTVPLPGDASLRLGVSLNNGPTVQDPFNSSFAWGYPFYAPKIAPGPSAGTVLSGLAAVGPNFAGNVIGVTAYAWYNEHLYLEAGGYQEMSPWLANRFGVGGGPTTPQVMPYARVAYEWDWGNNAAWVGAFFMHAAINPQYGTGLDSYNDYAIDGGYQFLGTGKHIATVQGIFVHEQQNLKGSAAAYNANNGTTVGSGYGLNSINLNLSYWYENTYGVTLAWSRIWGDDNVVAYGALAPSGSGFNATGTPNSNSFTLEADWVPFGKEKSLWRPFANLKLGASYTAYTELDGATSGASNNNTFFLFAWTAF